MEFKKKGYKKRLPQKLPQIETACKTRYNELQHLQRQRNRTAKNGGIRGIRSCGGHSNVAGRGIYDDVLNGRRLYGAAVCTAMCWNTPEQGVFFLCVFPKNRAIGKNKNRSKWKKVNRIVEKYDKNVIK